MIFKVQRAIDPPDAEVLVYNEDRSIMGQFPMTEELLTWFGDKYKLYIEGVFNESTGRIDLIRVVEEQEW